MKEHLCTYCHYPIPEGEVYRSQSGFYEGRAQRNKFHEECWEDCLEWGGEEFTPGTGEPPHRIKVWHDNKMEGPV